MRACKNQCILYAFPFFAAKLNFQRPKVVQQHKKFFVKILSNFVENFIRFPAVKKIENQL